MALFSPEHGFRGAADPGAAVASSVDSATGLPIYSLYGRTSAPTDEMLAGIDVLLVDLQDAGARYYTYITTTVDVMQAAGPKRHPGGRARPSQPDRRGGAGQRARAGTHHAGRPARRADAARPDAGRAGSARARRPRASRGDLVGRAGRGLAAGDAVRPAPACRSSRRAPTCAPSRASSIIPALCLFEGTNLSVGRGSDAPFEQIGAPWLDTAAVLSAFRQAAPAGGAGTRRHVHAPASRATASTPTPLVAGIRLEVTDRATYDPPATAVHLLAAIRRPASRASSAGSRSTSTAWRARRRCGRRSTRGPIRRRSSRAGSRRGGRSSSGGRRCCCTRSRRARRLAPPIRPIPVIALTGSADYPLPRHWVRGRG